MEGIPVFNPEAKVIKEFKALIERDRGSEGDAQGRKKLQATKELAFIALFVSLKSAYNRNYEPSVRTEELKRSLKLAPSWQPDDIVKEAMKQYAKTQVTPSSAMLTSVRNAIFSSQSIIGMLEKRLKRTMDALHTEDMIDGEEFDKLMDKALKDVEKVLDISAKLGKQLSDLDTLEKKYVKELEELKGKNQKTVNKHQLPPSQQ